MCCNNKSIRYAAFLQILQTPLSVIAHVAPANAIVDTPAIAMDVSATMLGASGSQKASDGKPTQGLDGVDLAPLVKGSSGEEARTFFWRTNYPNFLPQRAARQGDFKFMQDGQTQFLFNLRDDPGECENLLGKHPQLVNELRAAHAAWAATMPD